MELYSAASVYTAGGEGGLIFEMLVGLHIFFFFGGGVYSEVRAYIRGGALTGFCGTTQI